MSKVILLTGATDGIGLAAAHKLVSLGHTLLVHGRNADKLRKVEKTLNEIGANRVTTYQADLANLTDVDTFASTLLANHPHIDVLINNAGILKSPAPITPDNLDVRFVVNTFAPYLLTKRLLPVMNNTGRIINVSSAGQSPVDLKVMVGKSHLSEAFNAYTQSKLAITMWSCQLGRKLGDAGPIVIAVNPGSLLASKMVKEGFGIDGKDINIGTDIVVRTSLSDEFVDATGRYFDNDSGKLAPPHADALDPEKCAALINTMEQLLVERIQSDSFRDPK